MANLTDITIIFRATTKKRINEIKDIVAINNSDAINFEIGIVLDRKLLGYRYLVLKTTSKWSLEKSNVEELFGVFSPEEKHLGIFSIFIGCEVDGNFVGMNSYEYDKKILFYPKSDYGDEQEMFDSADFELPDEVLDVLGITNEVYVAIKKTEYDIEVVGIAKTKDLIIDKIINDLEKSKEKGIRKRLSGFNSYNESKIEYIIKKTEKP